MMPAASEGETWDGDCGRSAGLCRLKLVEELLLGVSGREELGELCKDGGYHEFVGISCGSGWACCSWDPLYVNIVNHKILFKLITG